MKVQNMFSPGTRAWDSCELLMMTHQPCPITWKLLFPRSFNQRHNWKQTAMKKFFLMLVTILYCLSCKDKQSRPIPVGSIRTVKTGLNYPWEIIWGPDNQIW